MTLNLKKYVKTENAKNGGKPPCTYIKYTKGEKGYGILAQLRNMGVRGDNLNRLVEDVLEQALAEKKK